MASTNYLAEELIFQILSLLPVLSLLRCKSVCKLWNSIISHPQFIQAHLNISNKKQHLSSVLRVVSRHALQDFFIDTRGDDSVKLALPEYMSGMHVDLCSCNDLVTLFDKNNVGVIYIWNPLTRFFKLLPKPKICLHDDDYLGFKVNLGFVFDSASNDYKILRVVYGVFSFRIGAVVEIMVELYSVNSNTWKEIRFPEETEDYELNVLSRCVCVDSGVMYFQGTEGIMSFDLHNEVFAFCKYPESGERMSDVLEFDGSIAVILKSGGEGSVLSLWMLDDVGGDFPWMKRFNIEPNLKIDYVHLYLGDGQFLAQDYCLGYFFYDEKKKGNKKFPPVACVFGECKSVVQFRGSLVSLEGFERRE